MLLVDGSWIEENLDDIKLVDVRRRVDYEQSHMPNAINIPVTEYVRSEGELKRMPLYQELESILGRSGIGSDDMVVVYDDQNGVYSSRFLWTLERLGHRRMALFEMNYEDYMMNNGPTTKDETRYPSSEYKSNPMDENIADKDLVLSKLKGGRSRVMDVRDRVDFLSGHIDRAMSMPWRICLGRGKVFAPLERLRIIFHEHFVDEDVDVITYCKDGMTSSHTYIALRLLGRKNVHLYAGGYAEWRSIRELPRFSELEAAEG